MNFVFRFSRFLYVVSNTFFNNKISNSDTTAKIDFYILRKKRVIEIFVFCSTENQKVLGCRTVVQYRERDKRKT